MIDLRSDTVTKPSIGMREAMMSAQVGDDVYSDDPTVNSLEERIAELLGTQAALFAPSGSLANQLALRLLVKPGEEFICDEQAHVVRAELGAAAVFSGITTRTWRSERGILRADDALATARPDGGPYLVSTTAIAVENTHNFGGGTIQPIEEIVKLRTQSRALGLAMHLDGARLWNAHIATGISLKDYGRNFDTISVCLSKGLGAPIGSVLATTKENIASARIWRKRYGGGMRQVGILAAAGHFALDNNLQLLGEDHRRAKLIAQACNSAVASTINPHHVETNIVALDLAGLSITAPMLNEQLREQGIAASALGPKFLRLVTHLDITDADIEKVCQVLPELLKRALVA
jgi:threonine aldolase